MARSKMKMKMKMVEKSLCKERGLREEFQELEQLAGDAKRRREDLMKKLSGEREMLEESIRKKFHFSTEMQQLKDVKHQPIYINEILQVLFILRIIGE